MPPAPESTPQPPLRPRRPPSSPWRANRLPPDSERFFVPRPVSRGRPDDRSEEYQGRADERDDFHGGYDDYNDRRDDHKERRGRHDDSRSHRETRSRHEHTSHHDEHRSRHGESRSHHETRSRHNESKSHHEIRNRQEDTRSYHGPRSKHEDTRSYHEPPRDRHEDFRSHRDSRERLDDRRNLHDSRDRLEDSRSYQEPRGRHEDSRNYRDPTESHRGSRDRLDDPNICRGCRGRIDDSKRYHESRGRHDDRSRMESRGRLESRGRPESRSRLESRGRPDSRGMRSPRRREYSSRPRSNSALPDITPSESPTVSSPQTPPTHASLPFTKVKPSARVNPVFLRPKDTYPFVVVNDISGEPGEKTSSKVSPYFPRAFKGHPARTVMSAPPVRKPKKKPPPPVSTWQPNAKRRIPRLCNKYGRCNHDTPTRSLAGIIPEGMLKKKVLPTDEELDEEEEELEISVNQAGTHHHDMWNKTTGVVRVAHHSKTASQKPVPPSKRKFGFPFAPFPAKKFMNLRGRKKPQQDRPASSGRKTFLGITSLNRMTHPRTQSRRFTSLAKLTRTFGGGSKKQVTRPPSARKFSAVAGLTNMGIKVTGEVRPDWTVQEDEPEYVSCCCCRRQRNDQSTDKIIRSKSLERMETIDKDSNQEGEETAEKETKGRKKTCLCCYCGNEEEEEDEEAENETEETEVKPKPTKSKKKAFCWRRQDSSDDVRSNGTKLSEVQLLPGKLESEGAKTKGDKWAVKTKSQEAQDYVPPKKKKKRCFWCCYKTEESNKVEDVQSSQIQPTEKVKSSGKNKSKGRNLAKLQSQDSKQSELDCNRKCKVCWLACCCGCTCSTKPHTKSMAIQAMSADIRTSMMQLPGQLRVPSTNDSGDAMVIQSLLSGNPKQLTPKTDQGRGPSPDRPSLDPNVQRSVSAVMRHLSPERKKKGCACFSCCKKSPEVHRKSVKRKTNWICCTVRKKKKTSSQESLTSISKLPPDVQPTPAPGEKKKKKKSTVSCWGKKKMSPEIHPVSARKRKKTLGERLCGGWLKKTKGGKVPLKAKRRAGGGKGGGWCCGWMKKGPPKTGAQPPAKERRSLKAMLCGCFKTKKSKPKDQPKQGLCRRMFCCCCKPKLGPAPTSVSTTEAAQQAAAAAGVAGGKKNEMPPLKPLTRPNLWKRIFCCKCQKSPDMGSRKSYGSKRGDMASRASSLASFPKLEATLVEHSSMMKAAIPVLPICLAWTCLILNVFIPGSGTIISGFLCVCFGKPRFSVKDSTFARLGALCVNIVIGVGQMFTIIFCFVGWGWSIWWGVIMLRLARKYRRIKQAELNPIETPVTPNEDAENGH